MRDILAPAGLAEPWADSLRYACQLANWMRAGLTVVAQAQPVEDVTGRSEAFGCFASSLGVKHCQWIEHQGNLAAALAHLAQWHDLVVLGEDDVPRGMAEGPQLVEHAPCLVVPPGWASQLRPACIAAEWDASLAAVLALRASLPLLERSGRVVFLLASAQQTRYVEPGLPAFQLEDFCTRHELKTEFRIVPSPADAGVLLEAAMGRQAELLVAAHGRTGAGPRVMHPVTEGLLRRSPMPVFVF